MSLIETFTNFTDPDDEDYPGLYLRDFQFQKKFLPKKLKKFHFDFSKTKIPNATNGNGFKDLRHFRNWSTAHVLFPKKQKKK
jgi:hypothetical protein